MGNLPSPDTTSGAKTSEGYISSGSIKIDKQRPLLESESNRVPLPDPKVKAFTEQRLREIADQIKKYVADRKKGAPSEEKGVDSQPLSQEQTS